ncbi:MAG: transposase, partial [Oligoflexales bacterium]
SSFEEHNVEPNSLLGDAIRYFTKHEHGLRIFLEVPGAKLDNNSMEQALKLVVLGRKNFYFFKSKVGAAVADVIMSLVASVSKAGINLFEYLCNLQRYHKEVKAEPEKWLPWVYEKTIESMKLAA